MRSNHCDSVNPNLTSDVWTSCLDFPCVSCSHNGIRYMYTHATFH